MPFFNNLDDRDWKAEGRNGRTSQDTSRRKVGGWKSADNRTHDTGSSNRMDMGMRSDLRLCHNCQQPGHVAKDCKTPRFGRSGAQNGRNEFKLASAPQSSGTNTPHAQVVNVPAATAPNTLCASGSQNGMSYHQKMKIGQDHRYCHESKPYSRCPPTSKENARPTFGFNRLLGFLTTDEPDSVIMAIGRNIPEWVDLFNPNRSQSNDFFPLILHILARKVCKEETVLKPSQIAITMNTFQDNFIKRLQTLYSTMVMGDIVSGSPGIDTSRIGIMRSIHTILAFAHLRSPSLSRDYLFQPALGGIGLLSTMQIMSRDPVVDELLANFSTLLQSIQMAEQKLKEEDIAKKRLKKQEFSELLEKELHGMAPPDDFRDIPIIPTIQEIFSTEEPFLRTNKKTGRYADADHYLDVQFRLLREDFVNPLKKGIQDFMKNRTDYLSRKKRLPLGSVRIYPDTKIKNVNLIRDTLTYTIQLPMAMTSRIKWDRSKRLLNGSLLVFTHDNFNSAYFGVVARRIIPELQQGIIGITWEGDPPEFDKTFLMVECEVYFEAYRHTLAILKKIELGSFQLAKFIVEASDQVCAPKYLEEATHQMEIGGQVFSPLVGPWPSATQLGLDENQFLAFQAALSKEFSIIQGPPGTGKTYLGLKIAQIFLSNLHSWWGRSGDGKGPILVVCYTNHALDQFLEGILQILKDLEPDQEPGLIRVGGRSKCEDLDPFSLANKRIAASRMRSYERGFSEAQYEANASVRELKSKRAAIIGKAVAFGNLEGLINIDAYTEELKGVISSTIMNAMKNPEWFGLTNDIFLSPSFAPLELIRKWFNITPPVAHATTSAQKVNVENRDPEDEEDYDLDELLANRIGVEDEEIEFEMTNCETNGEKLQYLDLCSVSKCEMAIQNHQYAIEKLAESAEKLTFAQQAKERTRLATEIRFAENRKKFFELLMKSQREGLLQLPDLTDSLGPDTLLSFSELNAFSLAQRWSLYFSAMDKARMLGVQRTSKVSELLVQAQQKLDTIRRAGDGQILRKAKVVGMTTTGAAKNHDLLQMMQSKIVIVEEAAEVLESHIVTCITKHCQQLILIGDHQQLRPSTTVYDLSKKYFLDISLFERMLNNNLNCFRLKVQHRMRPEIADLVVGTIYPELHNHPNVENYPDVKGMDKNLFFIDHQEHEKSEADSMSKSNEHEAKILAGLCRHLILQGYNPSEITVLTTYTGQMFLLKKEISTLQSCNGIRVTVVDNYQGEENKVILLSLVRSNEDNNIGFLKTDNRICVAISRAKHGLYICGNMTNLTSGSKTWKEIRRKLAAREEIGQELKLICEIHGTVTSITNPIDFRTKSPEGGCSALCKIVLKCTHECESVCHTSDRGHLRYRCRKPCLKFCVNDHPCREKCFVKCYPCTVQMEKALPCQHVLTLPCHKDPADVKCMVMVEKQKPCGHLETMPCSTNPANVRCREVVPKTLPCKHVKNAECHVDPGLITCKVHVLKVLVPCGHEQIAECRMHPEMISCDTEVEKEFDDCKHKRLIKCKELKKSTPYCKEPCSNRLDCGHQCTKICHVLNDPHHVDYKCLKECARQCENGHPCTKHKCSEACPQCEIKIEKVLSCRRHKSIVACKVPVGSILCQDRCEQRLASCNHKCTKKCCEECLPCQTPVFKRSLCGHSQLVKCSEKPSPTNCEERVRPKELSACLHEVLVPCNVKDSISPDKIVDYCDRSCGYEFEDKNPKGCHHKCKGTCSECLQGRLHKKCQEECGRILVCGHVCSSPCSSVCPPCQKECFMKCEHSSCQQICGTPCTGCKEKCSWKCMHKSCSNLCSENCDRDPCDEPCQKILKCGHPCVGFCGEPCPPLCRVCDKEKLTEFQLYGNEGDDDARFVYLEDCKHTIEAEGLTYHMQLELEEGEIGAKACPRCKTIIRQSKRYGNILRKRLGDVMKVKKKVFGDQDIVQPKQQALVVEILQKAEWIQVLSQTNPEITNYFLNKLVRTLPPQRAGGQPRMQLCKVSSGNFRSLELIAAHGRDVVRLFKACEPLLRPEDFASLCRKYGRLFNQLLSRGLPLTKTEVENFENEFDRHHDMCETYKRRGSASFTNRHSIAVPLYKRATNLLQSMRPYKSNMKELLHGILKELDTTLRTGLGINDRERKEILAAINMASGRWFKCPNGHVYLITECGGATMESKCNECGAAIGGANHQVRSDNRLATEMDGATAPLYPQ